MLYIGPWMAQVQPLLTPIFAPWVACVLAITSFSKFQDHPLLFLVCILISANLLK